MPIDGQKWNARHVRIFLLRFIRKYDVQEPYKSRILDLGTRGGNLLFMADLKSLRLHIRDEPMARLLYRELGGDSIQL